MQASYNRFLRSVTGNMVMCYVEGECVLKKCWWVDYNQDSMFLGRYRHLCMLATTVQFALLVTGNDSTS